MNNCFVTINVESNILGHGTVPCVFPLSRILKIAPRDGADLFEVQLATYNGGQNEVVVTKDSSEDIFSTATFVLSTASFVNMSTE